MIAHVLLISSKKNSFWYAVPSHLEDDIYAGMFVIIPLQKRTTIGCVITIAQDHTLTRSFALKSILACADVPRDMHFHFFLQEVAAFYYLEWQVLLLKLAGFLSFKELILPDFDFHNNSNLLPSLNQQQQAVVDCVAPFLVTQQYIPLLMHGVTGSGKTEVYKALIVQTLEQKKSVILLLPEINLAIAFERRLRAELPSIALFALHSAVSLKNKQNLWAWVVKGNPCLIIGVHMPVFLPFSNLGLIIIDEEHELGYEEKKHPKINSKQSALLRAQQMKIPIILGSATPSLESLHQVKLKKYYFFQLTHRFGGLLPQVSLVPLKVRDRRPFFWISTQLQQELALCLEKKQQALIFLNRRGYAFSVQCSDCGYIFRCHYCSVSLTFHAPDRLICHYCGFIKICDTQCAACKADDVLIKNGIGTQQVLEMIQKLFPQARIARADLDTTTLQKKWQKTYTDFCQGTIDFLVGTQTIVKGHHFPGVSLVGVIWADMNFHLPQFNATEVAIQQLIQIAGRAGRVEASVGKVVVQTIDMHSNFDFLTESSYLQFYKYEIEQRRSLLYPPVGILIQCILVSNDQAILMQEAEDCKRFLDICVESCADIVLMGPTVPFIEKINKKHHRIIFCKSKDKKIIFGIINKLLAYAKRYKSDLFIQRQ